MQAPVHKYTSTRKLYRPHENLRLQPITVMVTMVTQCIVKVSIDVSHYWVQNCGRSMGLEILPGQKWEYCPSKG